MGKRFNVFVSEEAYQIIKEFQKSSFSENLDSTLDRFILKHGSAKKKEV